MLKGSRVWPHRFELLHLTLAKFFGMVFLDQKKGIDFGVILGTCDPGSSGE